MSEYRFLLITEATRRVFRVCAAADHLQILLVFPDLRLDWGLNQYTEAEAQNEGTTSNLGRGCNPPTTHLSAVKQCTDLPDYS